MHEFRVEWILNFDVESALLNLKSYLGLACKNMMLSLMLNYVELC